MNATSTGVDRRELLKKAAVAGGVAWVAPTIMAGKAWAGDVCTPKCTPGPFGTTFLMTGRDACADELFTCEGGGTVDPSANKVAVIRFYPHVSAECPCGGPATVIDVANFPALWYKGNTACPSRVDNTANIDACLIGTGVDPGEGPWFQFVLHKPGAIGNGWYAPSSPLCISVGCVDRDGDYVWRNCTITFCFFYSPSGPCSHTEWDALTTHVDDATCTTGCTNCAGQTNP